MYTQFFSEYPPPGLSVTGLEANKMNQTRQPSQHTDVTLHYELMNLGSILM